MFKGQGQTTLLSPLFSAHCVVRLISFDPFTWSIPNLVQGLQPCLIHISSNFKFCTKGGIYVSETFLVEVLISKVGWTCRVTCITIPGQDGSFYLLFFLSILFYFYSIELETTNQHWEQRNGWRKWEPLKNQITHLCQIPVNISCLLLRNSLLNDRW